MRSDRIRFRWRWMLIVCVGSAILSTAFFLTAWLWLGASEAVLAMLHGEAVVIIPATVELGDCLPGDERQMQFRVVNLSSSSVTLTGIYTSCSCLLASSLPMQLEARGASTLQLTVHASGDQGDFTRQAVLYTDSDASPQLPIKLVGRIVENDSAELEPIPQIDGPTPGDD
jgi:hypothetical protein